jgi:hypothetical protein
MEVAGANALRLQFAFPTPPRVGGPTRDVRFANRGRYRERKAPWGHAPLRGSRRESAVAQLSTLDRISPASP